MSSGLMVDPTIDIIGGKIETVGGYLRTLSAKVQKQKWALECSPLTYISLFLLRKINWYFRKTSLKDFDPEFAGEVGTQIVDLCGRIQKLAIQSGQIGLDNHFPFNIILNKLELESQELRKVASILKEVNNEWQKFIEEKAQQNFSPLSNDQIESFDFPLDLFDSQNEEQESPSAEALRSHLRRTLSSNK
jgi:hypothetical protein